MKPHCKNKTVKIFLHFFVLLLDLKQIALFNCICRDMLVFIILILIKHLATFWSFQSTFNIIVYIKSILRKLIIKHISDKICTRLESGIMKQILAYFNTIRFTKLVNRYTWLLVEFRRQCLSKYLIKLNIWAVVISGIKND